VQSLCRNWLTNIELLLHSICHSVALAFSAPREIQRTQCESFLHKGQQVETFESVGPITVQEKKTVPLNGSFAEKRNTKFFVARVGDWKKAVLKF
jgi:hypothetical protein